MRPRLAGIAALIAFSALEVYALEVPALAVPALTVPLNNEHHEFWIARPRSSKRAILPGYKAAIDAAVASTASLPHYFWTGQLPPFGGREDSVEPRARDAAMRRGGTTLEDTVENLNMPAFSQQDQDSVDTWVYASQAYANASTGVAYVFRGEQVRAGNVFDTQEYPLLVANPAVTGIYQINASTKMMNT
ncbi:hypothetical protein B0H11DRAFT_81329 [Mycena galericulata]|nr:hypothetical protein B0H11DRAFT_81329 [Mycena galericulata]